MRKYLKFIALCLLAALILWWFGRGLNWAEVRAALTQADWRWVAAAIAVVCSSYLIRAYRWRALLAPLAPAVGLRSLFAATTVGFGAVFLLGRAGEVARPSFLTLSERRVRPGASFITIGVERVYDLTAIIVIFAANLLWFRAPGGALAEYERVRQAGVVLLGLAAAGIIALIIFRRYARPIIGWLETKLAYAPALMQRVGGIALGLLEQLSRALGVLVDARALAVTVGWTVLLWVAITLSYVFMFRAFGLQLDLSATIFVMGWGLVGSLVPTPGGAAGAFHAAAAAGLIFLGIGREQAAAVSIATHLVVFAPAFFLGLYYFMRSGVRLAGLRRAAGETAVMSGDESSFAAAEDKAVARS